MTNRKSTKRALLGSVVALALCLAMLVGSTFAWFTDTASTGVNKIQAGNLDIEIQDENGNAIKNLAWKTQGGTAFDEEQNPLWEPGCTYELTPFKIVNNGNLALKYKIVVTGLEGDSGLLKVITFTYTTADGTFDITKEGHLAAKGTAKASTGLITLTGKMDPAAGNEYMNKELKDITITVLATQDTVESDSFGNTYDDLALYPDVTIIDKGEGKADDALSQNDEIINVALQEDVSVDVKPYDQKPLGGEKTKQIIIDGQGHKLTFNNTNSDWNNITWGDAKLVIKNAVIDNSGYNAAGGAWNSHNITFKGNVELENVTFLNAVALDGTASLKNVTISDPTATQDTYMLWICAGSNVTLDGCTINGNSTAGKANRAIAIKDQYVTDPGMTTLVVKNSTITADKYAAVLVTSAGGANITMENVDISGTQDNTNAVWYDGDGANITVTGCTKMAR